MTDTPTLITMDGEYQTRDGRKVEVISTKVPNPAYPVAAWVENRHKSCNSLVKQYSADGRVTAFHEAPGDLVPVPKTYVRWMNVYIEEDRILYPGVVLYLTEGEAKRNRPTGCFATVRIEFTEGEGQ